MTHRGGGVEWRGGQEKRKKKRTHQIPQPPQSYLRIRDPYPSPTLRPCASTWYAGHGDASKSLAHELEARRQKSHAKVCRSRRNVAVGMYEVSGSLRKQH